jgi:hypothetical protein
VSQHRFTTPQHTIILGWDDPLQTFFAQVWPGHSEEGWEEPEHWVGCNLEEVPTIVALADQLKPFAEIPAEIADSLRRDHSDRDPSARPFIHLCSPPSAQKFS